MLEHGKKNDVKVVFANVSDRLRDSLEAYELIDVVGGEKLVLKSLEDVFTVMVGEVEEEPSSTRSSHSGSNAEKGDGLTVGKVVEGPPTPSA